MRNVLSPKQTAECNDLLAVSSDLDRLGWKRQPCEEVASLRVPEPLVEKHLNPTFSYCMSTIYLKTHTLGRGATDPCTSSNAGLHCHARIADIWYIMIPYLRVMSKLRKRAGLVPHSFTLKDCSWFLQLIPQDTYRNMTYTLIGSELCSRLKVSAAVWDLFYVLALCLGACVRGWGWKRD